MDAFAVAAELLGNIELTSSQLAGLRAINHKYFTEVYALLHPPGEEDARTAAASPEPVTPAAEPTLTPRQTAGLRAMLERDVLALLTPAQRAALGAR